ncbi:SDR family NAD(P)-dependent oxidoreductase [Undibacterium pigrum]|uniref:NADP-dependent 3-hydroxy acid dehydrogenase YdfG n=1 Tax=Undibacterium pigrum TaxID=401470 RepID=A0A318J0F0_9BURK|nr:SDR family NAD(P)-dependent oxidoreductase [Undibacterium pigrum]PXX40180.1 NADP-dependent 3-hydroxy acid dehydrogenase YdfG [Undibacterium pigrum]
MNSLDKKLVVITGAASGIGEALAHVCADAGAYLLLADIDSQRLKTLAAALTAQFKNTGTSQRVLTQSCDVASEADMHALAATASLEFGGADILINNAGVALVAPILSGKLVDAHWLMDINFWGVVHGCRAFASQMHARPDTVIVNISSIFAMLSLPTQSIYNASKAAVRAFSDSLREELRVSVNSDDAGDKHSIHVLCVHPGGIRTRLVEQARLGDITAMAADTDSLNQQFKRIARTSPEQAAMAIMQAVSKRKTRLLIGADARVGDFFYRLFPARASAWFAGLLRRQGRNGRSGN